MIKSLAGLVLLFLSFGAGAQEVSGQGVGIALCHEVKQIPEKRVSDWAMGYVTGLNKTNRTRTPAMEPMLYQTISSFCSRNPGQSVEAATLAWYDVYKRPIKN